METWGSWTFSEENKCLLTKVLDKFVSDKCSLDASRKFILSSLAVFPQASAVELISDTSSDNCSDVDEDFQACFPKLSTVKTSSHDSMVVSVVNDQPSCSNVSMAPDPFDSDLLFLTQKPVAVDRGNTIKLIGKLLNSRNFDKQELCLLLKTELKNGIEVLNIIEDVWPEIITDTARHGLCEALVKINVKPQIICDLIYLPWYKICESNLTGFIESVSELIVHFPEYACKSFLVGLLGDKESVLVKHVEWLAEIMKSLDQQYWCILLSEYMKHCNNLDHYQIPVLLQLVKNCQKGLNNSDTERLVALCRNAVHEHSTNRDFAMLLMSIIGVIDLVKFRPEMMVICGQLKGASKFLILKALKDTK